MTRGSVRTIRVSSVEAAVTLSGSAESGGASLRAQSIAEATFGVASVENGIEAPEATAEESAAAVQLPEAIAALEPSYATGVVNYATGEVVAPLDVVIRGALPRLDDGPSIPDAPSSPPVVDPAPPEVAGAEPNAMPNPVDDPSEPPDTERDPQGADPTVAAEATPIGTDAATVTVERGDSLWTISEEHLGDGHRWNELLQENDALLRGNPNRLRAGMELTIPR